MGGCSGTWSIPAQAPRFLQRGEIFEQRCVGGDQVLLGRVTSALGIQPVQSAGRSCTKTLASHDGRTHCRCIYAAQQADVGPANASIVFDEGFKGRIGCVFQELLARLMKLLVEDESIVIHSFAFFSHAP